MHQLHSFFLSLHIHICIHMHICVCINNQYHHQLFISISLSEIKQTNKLRKCGLDKWLVRWTENWLNGRTQRAVISGAESS